MSDADSFSYVSVEDYLKREETAPMRHEYVRGRLFAMTGSSEAHNVICGNLFSKLHAHLRGTGCCAYIHDMKVRIDAADCFYYPDLMVSCETFVPNAVFKASPVLIAEVLSPSTRQIDMREKLVAYQQLETLREYAIIHQRRPRIELHRKNIDASCTTHVFTGADAICFGSLQPQLTVYLSEIYEGLSFPSIVEEDEEETCAPY